MNRLLEGLAHRIPQSSPMFATIWPEDRVWGFCESKILGQVIMRINNESTDYARRSNPFCHDPFFSNNPRYIMFVAPSAINNLDQTRAVIFIKTIMPYRLSWAQIDQLDQSDDDNQFPAPFEVYMNNCDHLPPHPEDL